MIKIYIDKNKLTEPEKDTIILVTFADYINNYLKIIECIEGRKETTICIQNSVIVNWIKRIISWYSDVKFEYIEMDAKIFLERKWDIKIPEYLSNTDVLESGLLTKDLSIKEDESFENAILRNFYGLVFTNKFFPITKIVDIIDAYDEDIRARNYEKKLFNKVYLKRLEKWDNSKKSKEIILILEKLKNDIKGLELILMKYKVLRYYPGIGKNLLGKNFTILEKLNLYLDKLEIKENKIKDVINQIEYKLNDKKEPNTADEIEKYINNLSGNLLIEFEFVEKIIKDKPDNFNLELVKIIENKFSPILSKIKFKISALKKIIPPAFPKKPKSNWKAKRMLEWARDEYLPYFFWADRNEKIDENIVQLGDIFSNWLYDNWETISNNSKRMVFDFIPNNYKNLTSPDKISIVLIIDNLSWMYADFLQNLFEDFDFIQKERSSYLSMVPSETEISKKCLLSGESSYEKIDNKKYNKIVDEGWVPYFDNKEKFEYIPNVENFCKINNVDKNAYFINYLPIDRNLHKSISELGVSHEENIKFLLDNLVKKVMDFVIGKNIENKTTIHIISDHSSTKILPNIKNDIDPSLFSKNKFPDKSQRFLEVTDEEMSNFPDNLKVDCFFIEKNKFGNETNYICARRSNRFYESTESKYTHGGISPEEMIIPHLIFEKFFESIEELEVNLKENKFRYKLETVKLEIGNPYKVNIENLNISITNSNIKSDGYFLEKLTAKKEEAISFNARFFKTKSEEEQKYIGFKIKFSVAGKNYSYLSENHKIEMKSMFEEKNTGVFDEF